MSSKGVVEDLALLLYAFAALLPIIALGLRTSMGHGFSPETYLAALKDPRTFLAAVAASCSAGVLDVASSPPHQGSERLAAAGRNLYRVSAAYLIISLLTGLVVVRSPNILGAIGMIIDARLPLLTALVVTLAGWAFTYSMATGISRLKPHLPYLTFLAVPLALYGVWRSGLLGSLASAAAALALLLTSFLLFIVIRRYS